MESTCVAHSRAAVWHHGKVMSLPKIAERPEIDASVVRAAWRNDWLGAAALSALAWVWAMQLAPVRLPEPWPLPIKLLPLVAFLFTAYAVWRAIKERTTPINELALKQRLASSNPSLRHLMQNDPAAALQQLLPAGWQLTDVGRTHGDPLLALDTGSRLYGVRLHLGRVQLSGNGEDVFKAHLPVLAWLKKWSKEQQYHEAIWWLPNQPGNMRLQPNLQVVGGNALQFIETLQAAQPVPTKSETLRTSPTRTSRREQPAVRTRANEGALRQALDLLKPQLPSGWRLVEQIPVQSDFTLPSALLSVTNLPLALQIYAPGLSSEAVPRMTGSLEELAQRSGFTVIGWSLSEGDDVYTQGVHRIVFGSLETLVAILQEVEARQLKADAA